MRENIYNYLYDYGFTPSQIHDIEKENNEIFFTTLDEIDKNIKFLESKQLYKEEILEIIKKNPFMLTEKNNRLYELNELYNIVLRFDYESIIEILKTNPEAYTISPIELQKIIDFMNLCGYDVDFIKNLILKNTKILSMTLEEFKEAINLN